jgi:hypothetical protein
MGVDAIYLLTPTSQNVDRIIADFSQGRRTYKSAHLYFIDGESRALRVVLLVTRHVPLAVHTPSFLFVTGCVVGKEYRRRVFSLAPRTYIAETRHRRQISREAHPKHPSRRPQSVRRAVLQFLGAGGARLHITIAVVFLHYVWEPWRSDLGRHVDRGFRGRREGDQPVGAYHSQSRSSPSGPLFYMFFPSSLINQVPLPLRSRSPLGRHHATILSDANVRY